MACRRRRGASAVRIASTRGSQQGGSPDLISLATRIVIYTIAAASLNLILGYGGLVSFGHAAYFGVGAYAVGILYFHFSNAEPFLGFVPGTNQLLITIPVAVVVSAIFALVLGGLSLRTSGLQFIMITLAFAQMVFFLFVSLKYYGGDDGLIVRHRNVLFNLDMADDTTFYFVCLAVAAIYFFLFWRLAQSRFGLVLGGIRQNSAGSRRSAFQPTATNSWHSSSPARAPEWPAR